MLRIRVRLLDAWGRALAKKQTSTTTAAQPSAARTAKVNGTPSAARTAKVNGTPSAARTAEVNGTPALRHRIVSEYMTIAAGAQPTTDCGHFLKQPSVRRSHGGRAEPRLPRRQSSVLSFAAMACANVDKVASSSCSLNCLG